MKLVFLIGFIINSMLYATVLPDFASDYTIKNNPAISPIKLFKSPIAQISKMDLNINNLIFTSHLLFDSFRLRHQLIIYDPLAEPDNIFMILNPPFPSAHITPTKQQYSTTGSTLDIIERTNFTLYKSKCKISWNRLILASRLSTQLPIDQSWIKTEKVKNTIDENQFKYAGSTRFTLSGDLPNLSTEIKPMQASLALGVTVVAGIALHINQSAAWWDGKGSSFYVKDDWDNALFADKFGHFMGGYYISYAAREAFVYSGFSWDQSILFGSVLGLLSQTYVEFKDGYAENTGFSPSDFAADFAGVTYFYLQHYVPFLQNFSPKWQYSPPDMIEVTPEARTQTFLDNYNSTTAWISIHIRNLFWGEKESFWPKWLNIGLGYGLNGYCTPDICNRFVIGIDYNLVELLPDGVPFWNWFKQSLNGIKFPAPAFEFSHHGTKFMILYPFTISFGSSQF